MKNTQKTTLILSLGSIALLGCLTTSLSGCAVVAAGSAVTTGAMVSQDRRTNGTIVEDQSIELKAHQKVQAILNSQPQPDVKIVSYNNNVLLLGQCHNQKMRSAIEHSVKKIAKVRSVHNEIKLGEPRSLAAQSKDAWITTKIKSEMLVTKKFNPTHVKVITEGGVVYLLGIINKSEDETAVNIARRTKGVTRVVKMFEYLPA